MFGPLKSFASVNGNCESRKALRTTAVSSGIQDSDGIQKVKATTNAGRSLGAGCYRCPSVATRVFQILKTGSEVQVESSLKGEAVFVAKATT